MALQKNPEMLCFGELWSSNWFRSGIISKVNENDMHEILQLYEYEANKCREETNYE